MSRHVNKKQSVKWSAEKIFLLADLNKSMQHYVSLNRGNHSKFRSRHISSRAESNLFDTAYKTSKATGKQLLVLIKDCSFSRYIHLVLLQPSWKHAQQSSHHSHTELWQNWQAATPSRVLGNKTFLCHVFLCKYKGVPLHLSTWLFRPVFPAECEPVVLVSHMELRDVLRCGTKEAYNPAGITSCFWSLKWPVSLFLLPL